MYYTLHSFKIYYTKSHLINPAQILFHNVSRTYLKSFSKNELGNNHHTLIWIFHGICLFLLNLGCGIYSGTSGAISLYLNLTLYKYLPMQAWTRTDSCVLKMMAFFLLQYKEIHTLNFHTMKTKQKNSIVVKMVQPLFPKHVVCL